MKIRMKNFMDCWEYSTDELLQLVDLIIYLKKCAKNGYVPKLLKEQTVALIFNGMDFYRHPTQTLCDLVTIIENLPEGKELKDIKLVFVGSADAGESSANDLAKLLPRFGAEVVHLVPEGHELGGEFELGEKWMVEKNLKEIEIACKEGGGKYSWTNNVDEGVKNADFIYSGCYCYEGMEDDTDMKHFNDVFIGGGYQVSEQLLAKCPTAKTMHYLPALRGKEKTDYAMDFDGSLLWKQAENRLHTQRGLLAYLMADREMVTEEDKVRMEKDAWKIIDNMRLQFGAELTHN